MLEVHNADVSLRLPGDIRYDLMRSKRLKLVIWLVAAHHGSNSSSSGAIIDRLQADAVIYTAGYNDRYGHPATEVVERFALRGVRIYNSADRGAVTLSAETGQCHESVQRQRQRRYWTNG